MGKRQDTWFYSGDVNLEYGGNYIHLDSGYADVIRVTDLDSGIGFAGACLIERVSVPIFGNLSGRKRIRDAMQTCGWDIKTVLEWPQDIRWHVIIESLLGYGFYDTDSSETVQMESDGKMSFQGWSADKRLAGTDLKSYVESKYDCAITN